MQEIKYLENEKSLIIFEMLPFGKKVENTSFNDLPNFLPKSSCDKTSSN